MMAHNGAGANRSATRWLADACRLFLSREDTIVFDVDTGQIEQLGPAHQLEPMLHSLASAGLIEGGVPEVLKESWLASYCVTLLRNHRRFGFLQGIVDDCEQAGVGLLVLKGPAHIVRVWHDAGLRPMIDIDLLCRGEELSAVTEIVHAAGFEPLGKTSPFHLEFRTPDTGDRIELHAAWATIPAGAIIGGLAGGWLGDTAGRAAARHAFGEDESGGGLLPDAALDAAGELDTLAAQADAAGRALETLRPARPHPTIHQRIGQIGPITIQSAADNPRDVADAVTDQVVDRVRQALADDQRRLADTLVADPSPEGAF